MQNGERSAPALQEAACHGDGNEHVEHAGLRHDAGSRRSGGGVRRCGVRVGRQGVVRVHRLVSRQRGGVGRGDRALGQNLRRIKARLSHDSMQMREDCYAKRGTPKQLEHPRISQLDALF